MNARKSVVCFVALMPALIPLARPRFFDVLGGNPSVAEGAGGLATTVARLATGFMAAGGLLYALSLLQKPGMVRLTAITLGVVVLLLGQLSSLYWGLQPEFAPSIYIAIIYLLLIAFAPPCESTDQLVQFQKNILSVMIWGTCLSALFAPSWAFEWNYNQGYLSLPRLHGLSIHANHLSKFLWLYLTLLLHSGARSRWQKGTAFICLLEFFGTQSKTAWFAFVLSILSFLPVRIIGFWRRALPRSNVLPVAAAMLLLAISIFATILTIFMDGSITIPSSLGTRAQDLMTLTGRLQIWTYAIRIGLESPVFGLGYDPFSIGRSPLLMALMGWMPAQVHNVYIQFFTESGIVGLLTFIFYLGTLWFVAVRCTDARSRALAIALVLSWTMWGFTESWMRRTMTDGNFAVHLLIVSVLSACSRSKSASNSRRSNENVAHLLEIARKDPPRDRSI